MWNREKEKDIGHSRRGGSDGIITKLKDIITQKKERMEERRTVSRERSRSELWDKEESDRRYVETNNINWRNKR